MTGFRRGVSTSTLHAARSLLSFGDVVRAPVRGAREEGVFGFITGLYKGVAGAVVKPIIETGYGVRSLAKGFAACAEETDTGAHRVALRRRPPRVMYNAGGIREYDEAAAHLTQEFTIAPLVAGSSAADMLVIDHARNGISDHVVVKERGATPYLDHLLLLLTPTHLILVEMDSSGISVLWSLALARYRLFIVCSHGVLINAEQNLGKRREQRSMKVVRVGPRKGVYLQVPCDSAKVIQAVCKMLRPLRRTGL